MHTKNLVDKLVMFQKGKRVHDQGLTALYKQQHTGNMSKINDAVSHVTEYQARFFSDPEILALLKEWMYQCTMMA